MKCSVCNKEFGAGNRCAHCGADRVSGLGDYVGYKPSSNKSMQVGSQINSDPSDGFSVCWKCEQIIPKDAKFCPYCSTALVVSCPKCGHNHSSQYPSCPQCGTNRETYLEDKRKKDFLKKQEEEALERERQLAIIKENNRRFEEERQRKFIEAEKKKKKEEREREEKVFAETSRARQYNQVKALINSDKAHYKKLYCSLCETMKSKNTSHNIACAYLIIAPIYALIGGLVFGVGGLSGSISGYFSENTCIFLLVSAVLGLFIGAIVLFTNVLDYVPFRAEYELYKEISSLTPTGRLSVEDVMDIYNDIIK